MSYLAEDYLYFMAQVSTIFPGWRGFSTRKHESTNRIF